MRFAAVVAVLLTCAVASGCATRTAPQDGNAHQAVDVRVNNNLIPPTVVEIYFAPASGIERSLGRAFSSRWSEFQYSGLPPQGSYRLVARATDDRLMASNVIVMDGVLALEWNLLSNLVTVTRTTRDE